MGRKNNVKEDVWKKIDKKGEDECWEWKGYLNSRGYGKMGIDTKMYYTHRLVFELKKSTIPNGMFVLHTCDNPKCCNPKHLWLGTNNDNMKDKKEKGRGRTPCLTGEEQWCSKLTGKDVLEIREKYSTGKYSQTELGRKYGVNQPQISRIIHRKEWKHI